MSEVSEFRILYQGVSGPDVIELRELVQILKSVDGLLHTSGTLLHGGNAHTDARIHAIQPGSISITGAVSIISGLQPAFALLPMLSLHAKTVFDLVKIWIDIQKHLKGSPPQGVQFNQSSGDVNISNCEGSTITVHGNTYNNFVIADVPRKTAPLGIPFKKGAKSLSLVANGLEFSRISQDEAHALRPIKFSSEVIANEIEIILDVKGPVFEGSNQWRFKLGRNTITASVADGEFLAKVQDGQESFKNGDRIKVRLRTSQLARGRSIKPQFEVLQVVERL